MPSAATGEAEGGHLATIGSDEENAKACDVCSARGDAFDGQRWRACVIGLHRPKRWEWITGEPVAFTAWALGEPDLNPDAHEAIPNAWSEEDPQASVPATVAGIICGDADGYVMVPVAQFHHWVMLILLVLAVGGGAAYVFVESRRHKQIAMVIVEIKRCTHGRPLLPDADSPDGWRKHTVEEARDFELATYLRRLSTADLGVVAEIDGQKLRLYQCAVPVEHWQVTWDALVKPFMAQREAYYHAFGRRVAPELFFGVEPRFYDREPHEEPSVPTSPGPTEGSSEGRPLDRQWTGPTEGSPEGVPLDRLWATDLPVRRTFIHFTEAVASSARSRSVPPSTAI